MIAREEINYTLFSDLCYKVKLLTDTCEVKTFPTDVLGTSQTNEASGVESILPDIMELEKNANTVLLQAVTKQEQEKANEILKVTASWKILVAELSKNVLLKHPYFCNPKKVSRTHKVILTNPGGRTIITNTLEGVNERLTKYTSFVKADDVILLEGNPLIDGVYPVKSVTDTVISLNTRIAFPVAPPREPIITSVTCLGVHISSNIKDVVMFAMRQAAPIDLSSRTRYKYNIDYAKFKISIYESEFSDNPIFMNWKSHLNEIKTNNGEIPTIEVSNHADYNALIIAVEDVLDDPFPTDQTGMMAFLAKANIALRKLSDMYIKFPKNELLMQLETNLKHKLSTVSTMYPMIRTYAR